MRAAAASATNTTAPRIQNLSDVASRTWIVGSNTGRSSVVTIGATTSEGDHDAGGRSAGLDPAGASGDPSKPVDVDSGRGGSLFPSQRDAGAADVVSAVAVLSGCSCGGYHFPSEAIHQPGPCDTSLTGASSSAVVVRCQTDTRTIDSVSSPCHSLTNRRRLSLGSACAGLSPRCLGDDAQARALSG